MTAILSPATAAELTLLLHALESSLLESARDFLTTYEATSERELGTEKALALRDLDLSYLCARLLTARLAREGLLPATHVLLRLAYPWPVEWKAAYPLLSLPLLAPTGRLASAYLHLCTRLPTPSTDRSSARDDFAIDFLRSGVTLAQGPDRIRALIRRDAHGAHTAPILPQLLPLPPHQPQLHPPSHLVLRHRLPPHTQYTLRPPRHVHDPCASDDAEAGGGESGEVEGDKDNACALNRTVLPDRANEEGAAGQSSSSGLNCDAHPTHDLDQVQQKDQASSRVSPEHEHADHAATAEDAQKKEVEAPPRAETQLEPGHDSSQVLHPTEEQATQSDSGQEDEATPAGDVLNSLEKEQPPAPEPAACTPTVHPLVSSAPPVQDPALSQGTAESSAHVSACEAKTAEATEDTGADTPTPQVGSGVASSGCITHDVEVPSKVAATTEQRDVRATEASAPRRMSPSGEDDVPDAPPRSRSGTVTRTSPSPEGEAPVYTVDQVPEQVHQHPTDSDGSSSNSSSPLLYDLNTNSTEPERSDRETSQHTEASGRSSTRSLPSVRDSRHQHHLLTCNQDRPASDALSEEDQTTEYSTRVTLSPSEPDVKTTGSSRDSLTPTNPPFPNMLQVEEKQFKVTDVETATPSKEAHIARSFDKIRLNALMLMNKLKVNTRKPPPKRYIQYMFLHVLACQRLIPRLEIMRYVACDLAKLGLARGELPSEWPNYLLRLYPLLACSSHFLPSDGIFQVPVTSGDFSTSLEGEFQSFMIPDPAFMEKCMGWHPKTRPKDIPEVCQEIADFLRSEISALRPAISHAFSVEIGHCRFTVEELSSLAFPLDSLAETLVDCFKAKKWSEITPKKSHYKRWAYKMMCNHLFLAGLVPALEGYVKDPASRPLPAKEKRKPYPLDLTCLYPLLDVGLLRPWGAAARAQATGGKDWCQPPQPSFHDTRMLSLTLEKVKAVQERFVALLDQSPRHTVATATGKRFVLADENYTSAEENSASTDRHLLRSVEKSSLARKRKPSGVARKSKKIKVEATESS